MNQAENPETAERLYREAEGHRYRRAWSAALERYRRLIAEYPDSPEQFASRWAIGACLLGQGDVQDAWQHWRTFVDEAPSGPYRGQAWVGLGDIQLEHRFRLPDAQAAYEEALHRLREFQRLQEDEGVAIDSSWQRAAYEIHLRFGLIACIRKEREVALTSFERARSYESPRPPVLEGLGPLPTPVEDLINHCVSGGDLTPSVVLKVPLKEQSAGLMCFLGDFYLLGKQPVRAEALLRRVAEDRTIAANPNQRAYASYRLAEALYEREEFASCYQQLLQYLERYPSQPWTPDVLMRKGVAEYTRRKEPEQALATFRQVFERHSRHELAPAALWYAATIYRWQDQPAEALRIYRELNRRYPKNEFRPVIESTFIPALEGQLTGKP